MHDMTGLGKTSDADRPSDGRLPPLTRMSNGLLDLDAMRTRHLADGWWQDRTVGQLVAEHASVMPDADAYRWGDASLTWAAYSAGGDLLASRLAGSGVEPGDRVLVLAPDGGAVHAAFVGCERAGAVIVGVGWRAGVGELQHLVNRTAPRAMIVPEETRLGPGRALAADLGIPEVVIVATDDDGRIVSEGPTGEPGAPVDPHQLSMLNSTSGTTGLPKCVTQNQNRWFSFHRFAERFGRLSSDEQWMSVVPAPFGFGLWTSHYSPTILGVPCVVQERFDAEAAAAAIERHRVTVLCAVSSQFSMILDHVERHDLTSLRVLFTGGERIPLERARTFEHATGCRVLNFYGSNETGVLSGTDVDDPLERRISTGGRVVPEMQVRLYDDDLRRIPGDVGRGRPACQGPATSTGYFDDPAANDELFVDETWMLMGDVVEIDADGWLTVVGRSADFIVRGGKNISAPAVEDEIDSHPAVELAAVVPIPDDRLGELVGACVSLRPGHTLDLAELCAHLDARGVSKEWWPQRLAIVDVMPTSSGGKIAKGDLRRDIDRLFGES